MRTLSSPAVSELGAAVQRSGDIGLRRDGHIMIASSSALWKAGGAMPADTLEARSSMAASRGMMKNGSARIGPA
jgi:hypothetical protein